MNWVSHGFFSLGKLSRPWSTGIGITGLVFLAAVVLAPTVYAQEETSELQEAEARLRGGAYEEARQLFAALPVEDARSVLGYVETYLAVGEYASGLDQISRLLDEHPGNPYLLHARGLLHESVGDFSAALSDYESSLESAPEFWPNVMALSNLLDDTGDRSRARELQIRLYRAYQKGQLQTATDLCLAARAAANLQQFHQANRAFREANKREPSHVETLYRWGELFREKYNTADAERTFKDALAQNPRHAGSFIGLARTTNDFAQKEKLARRALDINPNSVGAQNVLGELRVLDGQYAEARSILRDALEINPSATGTLAQLASIHFLEGDSTAYERIERRALEINPGSGEFYLTIVENIVRRFRYPAAVDFARRAVQVAPDNWEAYATLGTSLLRMGEAEEARQLLEISFDRDPFNLFVGNTLTLLDERQEFTTMESEHFRLLIHPSEDEVLGPSILSWAETAYDSMAGRYPYRPSRKILLEAYNNADDFAVRVAGVPHVGLLGVSFGDVLAITTPRARPDEPFNWARTLWHEIAHTMAIGISHHQVPRWFTEGLSVYEERQARTEWGRDMEVKLFAAFDRDRLLPLEEIDRGFTRPEFPGQIMLTYYHASKVIEFIVDRHGFGAVVDILSDLGEGRSIERAIRQSLGQSISALDEAFRASLSRERTAFADVLRNFPGIPAGRPANAAWLDSASTGGSNPFLEHLQRGHTALERQSYDEAETSFTRAIDIYPSYIGARNAYEGLAAVYRAREDEQALMNILTKYLAVTEYGASEARELAALHREREQDERAIRYLERSLQSEPYDLNTRSQLGDLYRRSGRHVEAVRERRAVLDLDPVNESDAYYQLAVDLYMANRPGEAKDAVVRALEIAPGYAEAQDLLLKCVSASSAEP